MLAKPKCYSRQCKWYVGIIQSDGTEATETNFCGAFPDGIPSDIAYGENKHTNIVKGQVKKYVYERDTDWENHWKNLPLDDVTKWSDINAQGIISED